MAESERDTFETFDQRFDQCIKRSARVEKLYTGCRWAEGPAYFPAGRYLVWRDIPNDRMLRWDETPARSACSAIRPATPMATPSTARAAWSPASMATGASPAPSMTDRSP